MGEKNSRPLNRRDQDAEEDLGKDQGIGHEMDHNDQAYRHTPLRKVGEEAVVADARTNYSA